MTATEESTRRALLRRGFALEWATLGWNVVGIVVLAIAAIPPGRSRWPGSAWTHSSRSAPPPW
jgi:hypothetical protein